MGFWDLSDGEDAKETASGAFEAGGGKIEVIPDGTSLLAVIDEAKWDRDRDGNRYVSLRWSALAPEELKNRKIFQKLWVLDDEPRAKDPEKKRDKAKRMLAAIDTNAGGKLLAKGETPTDESLTLHLTNKPMVIKVFVWEMEDRSTGTTNRGNWVGAVSPKTSPVSSKEDIDAGAAQMAKAQTKSRGMAQALDDEIPFAPQFL